MKGNERLLESYIDIPPDSHFSLQNLPYGAFSPDGKQKTRIGVAVGDYILDLSEIEKAGLFKDVLPEGNAIFDKPVLNDFMATGRKSWKAVRLKLFQLLDRDNPLLRDNRQLREKAVIPMKNAVMKMPVSIADYTDFYSSREHATNVGEMFRGKDNALMPNWLHLPVAYHGRASSVILSGTPIRRPMGQLKKPEEENPVFGETRLLDFELETGFLIGTGNRLGEAIPVEEAEEHIFGMVLVNDWSARDIQRWEYQPLGPFLGKNFGTSISPWIVTMEALEPFRTKGPVQNPLPLPYLKNEGNRAYDIHLEVWLKPGKTNQKTVICRSNFKYLYWDICQQLAHHTVNGCNMQTGDLLASGTISGPGPESYGSLLELTRAGKNPLQLSGGVRRTFLEDGDILGMTGWCQDDGFRVGFGEVTAEVMPALK